MKERFVVGKVEDLEIPREWKESHKGEWAVYEPYPELIIAEWCKTEAEAVKKAELLNKAERVREDIINYADERLEELSEEEIQFLREYTGGTIEIDI